MQRKKTKTKKQPPLFTKMKPKKGFVAVQLVVAVAHHGERSVFIVESYETPYDAVKGARESIPHGKLGYEAACVATGEATIHLVETYLPVPKRQVVKKAKTRVKKVAEPAEGGAQ